ncbi:MAG: TIGR03618 family F420-dependent PPOX class oxidoreductase [Candidatus Limnocylindria bacterium]
MTDPALTIERVLGDDLREWLTRELRYPVLGVNTPDGAPSQSVMWFDLDPDQPDTILINTKVGRAKDRYLRRDPRVSLCFEEGLTWVALRGRVELDDDRERALADIQALAVRYGDDPHDFDGQQRVTVRIRVEKVVRHD